MKKDLSLRESEMIVRDSRREGRMTFGLGEELWCWCGAGGKKRFSETIFRAIKMRKSGPFTVGLRKLGKKLLAGRLERV